MTGDEKKYSSISDIIDENGKGKKIETRPSFFEQITHCSFQKLLCLVSLIFRMDQNDLLKIISILVNVYPKTALTVLFYFKKVVNSGKKAIYNIHLSALDLLQLFKAHSMDDFLEGQNKTHFKAHSMDDFIEGENKVPFKAHSMDDFIEGKNKVPFKVHSMDDFREGENKAHLKAHSMDDFREGKNKASQIIGKGGKRFSSGSNKWESLSVSLGFRFGNVVCKLLFPFFETLADGRNTENQVMEPGIILQILEHIFELIVYLEELIQSYDPEIAHSKIAAFILRGWNNGHIPNVGVTLKYFLEFFIQSFGVFVRICIKFTKENSQGDSKPTDEETDEPIDKCEQQTRSPAMTKAGLKEHMASLRQMWCQEFSAGLAEDLLSEDRQRALRRFGKELGLKQFEIDNVLNRSSASLKEKGRALMEDWQQGRGGSIVRRGKQLEQEHFNETLEALKRCKNSRGDREAK
ncbi:uncharacterized protein [Branchiostoma lanceolatum]|uniref:uncharacterized protein n=1 Tax=Branchiostoma lanceolatum TaxID=7740 RepID=UPI003453F145